MKGDYRVNLPVFEGPLDLLLSLIKRDELEITRISLAQVADQYLAYLAQIQESRPDVLVAFLVVAAKLALIKSQALLPRPAAITPEGELDAGEELARQLRLYKQFKAAAGRLGERRQRGLRTYVRLAPPPRVESQLDLSDVTIADLLAAVQEALRLTPPAPSVDQVVSQARITVKGQMALIRQQLEKRRQLIFRDMLTAAAGRLEIAVTLLAILELLKQHQVAVRQEQLFGAIVIEPAVTSTTLQGSDHP